MLERKNTYSVPKTNWLWVKVLLLVILMMTLISVLNVKADTIDQGVKVGECDLDVIENQYNYIIKGVQIANTPSSIDLRPVLISTLDLVLSISKTDNCLVLIGLKDVEKIKQTLQVENLSNYDLSIIINRRIKQLNESSFLIPLPSIKQTLMSKKDELPQEKELENSINNSVVLENVCEAENQTLLTELKSSLASDSGVLSQKSKMFLNALIVRNKLEVIVPEVIDKQYGLIALKRLSEEINCFLDDEEIEKINQKTEKEFLCKNGEVVSDVILCSLD